MILHKPYLWLGKSGNPSTYTLEISINTNITGFTSSLKGDSNQFIITYTGGGVETIPTQKTLTGYGNFNPAQHSKVTVVIKDANGQVKGSCTVLTALADDDTGSIHPQLWLKFNNTSSYELYVYGHNGNISFVTPHYGDLNGTRTVSFNNNGPANEQTEPLDSTTAFNPGNIDSITAKVGTNLGDTSTGTSDADGSGGDGLLEDFFDD
ncbi:MAG TPA: hypothetical protein VE978_11095 [Chitinophagales bacterium]|nr:hypothetical protein [Chitinophagales bacterium]